MRVSIRGAVIARAARSLLPSLLLAACGERVVYLPCDASAGEPPLDASTTDTADAVSDTGPMFVDVVPLQDGFLPNEVVPTALVLHPRASCPTGREPHCGVVRVSGGYLSLGGGALPESQPPTSVVLVSAFRLDQHEVTVARFRRWVNAGMPAVRYPLRYPGDAVIHWRADSQAPELPRSFDMGQMRVTWTAAPGPFEDRPVNNVTVATAQSFCAWDGGRLPTEAQWEWVAFRLGLQGGNVRTYPHGDQATCEDAVYGQLDTCPIPTEEVPGPLPVGSRRPEGLFYDLGGNVREFTADIAFRYGDSGSGCLRGFAGRDPVCQSPMRLGLGLADRPQVRGASYIDPRPSTRDDRIAPCCNTSVTDDERRIYARYASPQVGFRCAYEDPGPFATP